MLVSSGLNNFVLQRLFMNVSKNGHLMKNYHFSYFRAPVTTYTDDDGRKVYANLTPHCVVDVRQVYQLVSRDERMRELTRRVRAAPDMGVAKQRWLPFVTPCGTFSRRNCQSLQELSGLLPIDIDKLASPQEAARLRSALAADPYLRPVLSFVSPSGCGVKCFLPYQVERIRRGDVSLLQLFQWAATYVEAMYGVAVDGSGKDVVRACFLCHDAEAVLNEE